MGWRVVEHTGDTAIELDGGSLGELLQAATGGLRAVYGGPGAGEAVSDEPIELRAESPEALIVDLLNELIFRFDARDLLADGLRVDRLVPAADGSWELRGRLSGRRIDPARRDVETEVKAATFHGLAVEVEGDGTWRARIVLDL